MSLKVALNITTKKETCNNMLLLIALSTFLCVVKWCIVLVMNDKGKLKEYLRVSEASKLLGVHANTLRNWDKQGLLKPIRVGVRKERRYKREDILKIIEKGEKK